jgi:hypothetical protein
MLDLRSYFDKSLDLNEGDKLFIPCLNTTHQASIRTQMSRMRKDYAKKQDYKVMELIGISNQELDDKLFVVIEKRNKLDDAFILKANGKIEQVTIGDDNDK